MTLDGRKVANVSRVGAPVAKKSMDEVALCHFRIESERAARRDRVREIRAFNLSV